MHVIYMDFSKGFVSVNHTVILSEFGPLDILWSFSALFASCPSNQTCKIFFEAYIFRSFSPLFCCIERFYSGYTMCVSSQWSIFRFSTDVTCNFQNDFRHNILTSKGFFLRLRLMKFHLSLFCGPFLKQNSSAQIKLVSLS